MKYIRKNPQWIVALVGSLCFVAVAAVMAERDSPLVVPSARDAHDLSTIFRTVAKDALPSIVSIETRGRSTSVGVRPQLPFDDEDSPFREFFKNDPRFRDFFRQMPQRRSPEVRGMGSGFIIDPAGIIMTNSHVVRGAERVMVRLSDGREFVATDVKSDPRSDLAIIRIESPGGLQAIRLGNSDQMEIGDWVLAVGSPFGLEMTVTAGIISGKGRGPGIAEREDFLQTDAAINPGNSGGPLLNLNGEVIGINTAISSRSGGSDGVGFAIPVNMARWVSDQLVTQGEVKRAYLGVTIQTVDSNLAEKFKTAVGRGAIVIQVMPDSPAEAAKLEPGDVILALDGKKVHSTRNLQGIVEQLDIGSTYELSFLRDGEPMTSKITVAEMPANLTVAGVDRPSQPGSASKNTFDDLGIEIHELTPEIGEQLGYEGAVGVVVSAVAPESPAARAGIGVGDLIQKVGSQAVASTDEFREAIKDESLEEGLLMLVRNQNGARFVVIKSDG